MTELQYNLLITAKELISFLDKNKIEYFFSSGSCLGAVRHKGFIPWDDDIDIFIKRNEYNKLLELIKTYNSNNYCFSNIFDKKYPFPFLKFYNMSLPIKEPKLLKKYAKTHLYIDIFPIDFLPNNDIQFKKVLRKQVFYKRILYSKYYNSSKNKFVVLLARIFSLFFNQKMIKKKLNSLGSKSKTKYMMDICWGTKYFCSNYFEKATKVPFENIQVNICEDYDNYLKTVYGNYMEMPQDSYKKSHNLELK